MNKEVVLILGASSEIGYQFIQNLKNCTVFAHFYSRIRSFSQLEQKNNVRIIPIQADLSQLDEVQGLINKIKEHDCIPNKILHFAASKLRYSHFKQLSFVDLEQDFNVQVRSITLVLQAFLPLIPKEKGGKVIFLLSSVTHGTPPKFLTGYVTIKYALMGLMKSLALEYADKNIQINAISPSMIETTFLSEIPEKLVELNASNHPLKRNASVEDILPLIDYLLLMDNGFVQGANIAINGGAVI